MGQTITLAVAIVVSAAFVGYLTYHSLFVSEFERVRESRIDRAVAVAAMIEACDEHSVSEKAAELLRRYVALHSRRYPGTQLSLVDYAGNVKFTTGGMTSSWAAVPVRASRGATAGQLGEYLKVVARGDAAVLEFSTPCLSAFAPITQLNEVLVVSTPLAELEAEVHERSIASAEAMGGASGLLLLMNVSGAWLAWRRAARIRAAAAAKVSQIREWSHRLLQRAPVPIFLQRNDRIIFANDDLAKLLGYSTTGELEGKSIYDLIDKASHDGVRERIAAMRERGAKEVEPLEEHWVRRDGSRVPVDVTARQEDFDQQRVIFVMARDLTERKRKEQVERESARVREELLQQVRTYFERMPMACVVHGPDHRIIDWNPAAERVFGYSREEALGRLKSELIVPDEVKPAVDDVFDRLRQGDMAAHLTNENLTKDGRIILCEWHNTPLISPEGAYAGAIAMAEDVTERRRLEEQLRQAQKMESLGLLAGGVAHDFNNILTVIMANAELAAMAQTNANLPPDTLAQSLTQIENAAHRAADLTRQLLSFSRRRLVKFEPVDVNKVVADSEKMLRRLIGEDVRLSVRASPELPNILGDAGQVAQVLMNLVVNARDAMPKGGALTIATRLVDEPGPQAEHDGESVGGPHVELSVTDTGAGIAPEVIHRIFEPFFTTKPAGVGTGLGLATAYGIVRQAHGRIRVESRLGAGTTFRVLIPVLTAAVNKPRVPTPEPASTKGTGETLLICEDEPLVRSVAEGILRRNGYTVIACADGEAALAELRRNQAIQLLITDVVMPVMNGRELADAAYQVRPDLRVLFISGYTADVVARHGVAQSTAQFLEKPFSPSALVRTVAQLLHTVKTA